MDKTTTTNNKINREDFYKKIVKNPLANVSAEFVGTIILILVLFVTAIQPTIVTIKSLQTKINELNDFNKGLETKISTLKTFLPQIQNYKYKIDLLSEVIPDGPQFPKLEKQIRYLVQRNQLSLVSLSFSGFPLITDGQEIKTISEEDKTTSKDNKEKTENKENSFNFDLSLRGNYNNLKSFLSQIRNLVRICKVDSISISGSKGSSLDQELTLVLKAEAYYKDF